MTIMDMQRRLYRLTDIIGNRELGIPAIIPVSASTWWRGVASGRYPKPIKIAERAIAWRSEEVDEIFERFYNNNKS